MKWPSSWPESWKDWCHWRCSKWRFHQSDHKGKERYQDQKGVVVATPNWSIYGDTTPRNQQKMNPFHLDSIERAHAEMVDVLKTRNIWYPWNPHMGGVQVATRWEVHICRTIWCFKMEWSSWSSPKGMTRVLWPPMSRTSSKCSLWSPSKMDVLRSWYSCMGWNTRCKI